MSYTVVSGRGGATGLLCSESNDFFTRRSSTLWLHQGAALVPEDVAEQLETAYAKQFAGHKCGGLNPGTLRAGRWRHDIDYGRTLEFADKAWLSNALDEMLGGRMRHKVGPTLHNTPELRKAAQRAYNATRRDVANHSSGPSPFASHRSWGGYSSADYACTDMCPSPPSLLEDALIARCDAGRDPDLATEEAPRPWRQKRKSPRRRK